MDQNLLQLCLVKFIYLLQVFQVTTDTYQEIYYVIFRAQSSKTPHFGPKFSSFCNQVRQKTKQMDLNLFQLCLIKLISLIEVIQLTTDTYQGTNQVIFRAPSSKTAHLDPIFSLFLQAGKAENEANGPNPVASVSNQTYSPITSNLVD